MDTVDPPDTDPADRTPREREMSRRSQNGAVNPWLILLAILLLGAGAYVGFALL